MRAAPKHHQCWYSGRRYFGRFATRLARRSGAAVLTGVGLFLLSSVGNPVTGAASAQPAPDGPPNLMSGGALPPLPDPEIPTVARDIGVAELPLLVTEPPAEEAAEELPVPVTGGPDSVANPFSPLLLPQPEVAPAPTTPAAPAITGQPPAAPSAPAAAAPAVTPAAAPPVSRVVPAPAPMARLSTPLPAALNARSSNTAVSTPTTTILGRTLGARSTATPNPLAETAAVRVPESPSILTATSRAGLTPLGLDDDGNFTSARSNRVSRSLSDMRVNYTAMATGTGVFRLGNSDVPVLVRVGEPLPGTKLVLSRLTRADAQFSQDDARHTLSLTP